MLGVWLPWRVFAPSGEISDLPCPHLLSLIWDRFRQKNDILPSLVSSLFPLLVTIANELLKQPPSTAQEAPTMLHLILKTYKTSIGVHLSPHQQSPESIVPWGQLLFKIVNLRVPNEAVPADEDEREKCEWWKTKKWAYNTLGRLFHRYVRLETRSCFLMVLVGMAIHLNCQVPCKTNTTNSPNTLLPYLLQKS